MGRTKTSSLPDGCRYGGRGEVICSLDALRGLPLALKQKRRKARKSRHRRRGK